MAKKKNYQEFTKQEYDYCIAKGRLMSPSKVPSQEELNKIEFYIRSPEGFPYREGYYAVLVEEANENLVEEVGYIRTPNGEENVDTQVLGCTLL